MSEYNLLACCCTQVCKAQAPDCVGGAPTRTRRPCWSRRRWRAETPEHEGALLEYVVIILDRGLVSDALRILLRLLVKSHGDARLRAVRRALPPCWPACMTVQACLPTWVRGLSCRLCGLRHANQCSWPLSDS